MHEDPEVKELESVWNQLHEPKASKDFKEKVRRAKLIEMRNSESLFDHVTDSLTVRDKNDFMYKIGQEVKKKTVSQ